MATRRRSAQVRTSSASLWTIRAPRSARHLSIIFAQPIGAFGMTGSANTSLHAFPTKSDSKTKL
jgi:hypothetical protein